MKNIKYIITIFLSIILLWSCEQEKGTVYTGDLSKEVSFSTGVYKHDIVDSDGKEIKVKVQRSSTLGTLDVPIIFKSTSTLFQMKDTVVHFADGAGEAYGIITHVGASGLSVGVSYTLTLNINNKINNISSGGIKTQKITIGRKLTWKSVGKGVFTSNDILGETKEVEVLSTEEDNSIYKAVGLYIKDYDILILVNKTKGTAVIPQQEIGLSVFGDDYPKTWLRADACSYSNGTITVTPGSASNFNRWIVVPAPGTTGAWVSSPEILVLPAGSY